MHNVHSTVVALMQMCKTLALLASVDEHTHCQLSDSSAWKSARAVILQQPLPPGCSAERMRRSLDDISEALARPVQVQPLMCRPRPVLDQVLHIVVTPRLAPHRFHYQYMPLV